MVSLGSLASFFFLFAPLSSQLNLAQCQRVAFSIFSGHWFRPNDNEITPRGVLMIDLGSIDG